MAIYNSKCVIQSLTYNEITCRTGMSGAWSGDIVVQVLSAVDEVLTAVCDDDCSYSYSAAATPPPVTVTPTTVCTK